MELDEAIKHCHEKAEELHDREIYTDTDGIECMDYECNQCAKEHEQLAEWLTDYKRLKALEEQERPTGEEWIPVEKKLPDQNGFYLVTALGYGKRPYVKFLGYDAVGKKWGEGGVVAWCNISPYEREAEE